MVKSQSLGNCVRYPDQISEFSIYCFLRSRNTKAVTVKFCVTGCHKLEKLSAYTSNYVLDFQKVH